MEPSDSNQEWQPADRVERLLRVQNNVTHLQILLQDRHQQSDSGELDRTTSDNDVD